MSEAQSFATLKQSSDLKQIDYDADFSPASGEHLANQTAMERAGRSQVHFEDSPVFQQMLKNIVTQGEVNAALLNRLLELEKRIARLEDRVNSFRS